MGQNRFHSAAAGISPGAVILIARLPPGHQDILHSLSLLVKTKTILAQSHLSQNIYDQKSLPVFEKQKIIDATQLLQTRLLKDNGYANF